MVVAEAPRQVRLRDRVGTFVGKIGRLIEGEIKGTPEWTTNGELRREMFGVRLTLEPALHKFGGTRVGNEVFVGIGPARGPSVIVRGVLSEDWEREIRNNPDFHEDESFHDVDQPISIDPYGFSWITGDPRNRSWRTRHILPADSREEPQILLTVKGREPRTFTPSSPSKHLEYMKDMLAEATHIHRLSREEVEKWLAEYNQMPDDLRRRAEIEQAYRDGNDDFLLPQMV